MWLNSGPLERHETGFCQPESRPSGKSTCKLIEIHLEKEKEYLRQHTACSDRKRRKKGPKRIPSVYLESSILSVDLPNPLVLRLTSSFHILSRRSTQIRCGLATNDPMCQEFSVSMSRHSGLIQLSLPGLIYKQATGSVGILNKHLRAL
jgi:hypothetical protein